MSLSLKIFLVDLGTVKTNQYPNDMYIIDVCKDIRAKFNYGEGGLDHGLLFKSQGLWLAPNKMLGHYDLQFGDVLEFRKKHRILKVKTLDGNIKNILFDESITVKAIVEVISQRIGLTNGDEYSLMRDEDSQTEAAKDRETKEKKKKNDKEAISPESNWLNPDKTLREQGLTEEDFVVLKKKFFVTDQNVDRTDPVQLVIMHAQAYKDIISGKLPCTGEEAAQLGGIMMQILHGNQDPTKHKPGFAKMKDFVPMEYIKNKEVEKNIYKEYSILQGLTELNAKFRYVQLIRSLKTYGTTFFIVSEPADRVKKKKAQQVLLGITKSSVIRMDIETKKIMYDWKLTHLRNWSATPKTFTIDLGDHESKYYQVETKEGEEIARLLSGYVEIIVKRRNMLTIRPKEQNMEEQAVVEEYVKPGQSKNVAAVTTSTFSQAASGVATNLANPVKSKGPAVAQDLDEIEDQELLLRLIRNGIDAIDGSARDLQTAMPIPVGTDAISVKWREDNAIINAESLSGHLGNLLAAVGSLVLNANGDTKAMDYDRIGGSLTSLVFASANSVQALRVLANLTSSDEDQDELIQVGRHLIETTVKFLKELQPVVTGHQVLTELNNAASNVAQAGTSLLIMTDKIDVSELNQSELIDAAGEVSTHLLQMIEKTKSSMDIFKNPTTKKLLAKKTKTISEATNALATISSVLSCVITNPYARDQLVDSAITVRDMVSEVKEFCLESTDKNGVAALLSSVESADQALVLLMDKTRNVDSSLESDIHYYQDQILELADIIHDIYEIPPELFASAKEMAIFGTRLTEVLQFKADLMDTKDEAEYLKEISSVITDLIAKFVSATKRTLSNPSDTTSKSQLLDITGNIRDFVSTECTPYVKASIVQNIVNAYKATMSCSNQVIANGRQVGPSIRDRTKITKLTKAGKAVIEKIPSAVKAIYDAKSNQYDFSPRLKLLESARDFVDPVLNLIAGVAEAAPYVSDNSGKIALLVASEKLNAELDILVSLLGVNGDILSELDFKSITEAFKQKELQEVDLAELLGIDIAEVTVTDHGQVLIGSLRNITNAFSNGEKGAQAKAIAIAIAEFQNIRSNLGRIDDTQFPAKKELLEVVGSVGEALTAFMLKVVKSEIENSEDLQEFSTNTVQYVHVFLNHLPRQKALIEAVGTIKKLTGKLEDKKNSLEVIPESSAIQTEMFTADIQRSLLAAATDLSAATQSLVNGAKQDAATLKSQILTLEDNYGKLIQAFAAVSNGDAESAEILNAIHNIGLETDFFLNCLQSSVPDRYNQGLNNQLMEAAKFVGDEVDVLIGIFANSSRGLDDYTKALQILNSAASIVGNINGPRHDQYAYADIQLITKGCQIQIFAKTNAILGSVGAADIVLLPPSILETCVLVQELLSRSIDGAYMLAAADPASIPAIPSMVNQEGIMRAIQSIRSGLHVFHAPTCSMSSAFNNALLVAKSTADLCNMCKYAGEKEESINDDMNSLSKELANFSSVLVTQMKEIAVDRSTENQRALTLSENSFTVCLDKIEYIFKNPEYSGQNIVPSMKAVALQKPILDNCTTSIQEARNLVLLCSSPSPINLEDITVCIARLCKSTFNISNLLNESSPASADFNAVQDILAESKKEINIAFEKLQQGEKLVDSGVDLTTFNKSLASVVQVVDELLASSESPDVHAIQQSLAELSQRIELVSKSAGGVVAQAKSESQKPILQYVNDLFSSLISYDQSLQSQCLDPNEIRLFNLKNESALIHQNVAKVVTKLREAETVDPIFSKAVEAVEEKMDQFENVVVPNISEDEQVSLGLTAKKLSESEKQLVAVLTEAVAEKNTEDYGRIASESSQLYGQIIFEVGNILRQSTDPVINDKLSSIVKDLGETTARAVVALKQGTKSGEQEVIGRTKVTQSIKELGIVFENLEEVKKELTSGIIACEQVAAQVTDMQGDLETSLSFAKAMQLNPATNADNFSAHKDGLLDNAQRLTEIFKTFVNANSLDQITLGILVTSSAEAMQDLKTKAIMAATSLSSTDYATQQELITSTLEVGEAMKILIGGTSTASGCKDGEEVAQLNKLIDNQFDVISQLVDVVKRLDNPESSRNFEAYQNVIETIKRSTTVLNNSEPALGTALPEELVTIANRLAISMANLVRNLEIPSDIFPLLNHVKNDIEALCRAGKAISANAPPDKASFTVGAVSQICLSAVEMLESIQQSEETGEMSSLKDEIQDKVKNITNAVNLVLVAAKNHVPEGYVDPKDPNVIAERELLSAAYAIEAAARRLSILSPAPAPREANENLKFEDQIVAAAKGIVAASSALVSSATSAQREIAVKGKVNIGDEKGAVYFSDGTWNEGLISAAKSVVGATTELCDSANLFVKAECPLERVLVSAKIVSSTTVQLLAATFVRIDPHSKVQIRLQSAGKAVTLATEQLLVASQNRIVKPAEGSISDLSEAGVSPHKAKILEMEIQMKILRLEKELEEARGQLSSLRRLKYNGAKKAVVAVNTFIGLGKAAAIKNPIQTNVYERTKYELPSNKTKVNSNKKTDAALLYSRAPHKPSVKSSETKKSDPSLVYGKSPYKRPNTASQENLKDDGTTTNSDVKAKASEKLEKKSDPSTIYGKSSYTYSVLRSAAKAETLKSDKTSGAPRVLNFKNAPARMSRIVSDKEPIKTSAISDVAQ